MASTEKKHGRTSRPLRVGRYFGALAVIWTLVVVSSLWWNLSESESATLEAARIQARTAFEKDVLYRRWNAGFGGVYVPVTPTTRPNPYLKVPDRDIATPGGRRLTKINPAYMTRQVHQLGALSLGVIGHITSLKPIRPQNAPDRWEAHALRAMARGAPEVSAVRRMGGQDYMRLMRPLVTEPGCLQCHGAQGYKVGDIRGGISVSVPLAPLMANNRGRQRAMFLTHLLLWLLGLGGLGLGTRHLGLGLQERLKAAQDRERLIAELQEALAKVKTLSGLVPICSNCKKIRDDQGFWQQVEVYVREHSEAEFSHGICPDCLRKLYPDIAGEVLAEPDD
ncbi:MAG: DUF3365 domain-containing protein [Proteobacteria bacterium]|nr:DUF3365 domain-containing protein [Pseudomonadota bacterium]